MYQNKSQDVDLDKIRGTKNRGTENRLAQTRPSRDTVAPPRVSPHQRQLLDAYNRLATGFANELRKLGLVDEAIQYSLTDASLQDMLQVNRNVRAYIQSVSYLIQMHSNPRGGVLIADMAAGDLNERLILKNPGFRNNPAAYLSALRGFKQRMEDLIAGFDRVVSQLQTHQQRRP